MYGSHSIPVSVEFQHKHASFYLTRHWKSDHLNQILFNQEKYIFKKKTFCIIRHYFVSENTFLLIFWPVVIFYK